MKSLNATDPPSSQEQIDAARVALVDAERTCAELEARGITPHLDHDFVDAAGVLRHDGLECAWCARRDLASRYRAALRSIVITSTIKPKRKSRDAAAAHRREMARLRSIYDNLGDKPVSCMVLDPLSGKWCVDPELSAISDSIAARMNEMGEIEPGAKYLPRRIEIAAEIERLSYEAEAHNMKLLEIERRRRVKDAETTALRASLKLR